LTATVPAAVVMAGGRAERMGGVAKPALPLCGKPMVGWVVDAARTVARRVVVASSPYTSRELRLAGVCWQADACIELSGKGYHVDVGLAANIIAARPLLVLPADTPFLTGELLREFIARGLEAGACLVTLEAERGPLGISLISCGWTPWTTIHVDLGVHGLNVNTWRDYAEALKLCRRLTGGAMVEG
jgi:adenosylcobinamide-phosphate guanylyltransferase